MPVRVPSMVQIDLFANYLYLIRILDITKLFVLKLVEVIVII